MTHQMLLATLVLTGVFTEQELTDFLAWDEANNKHYGQEDWTVFVAEVQAWKKLQKKKKNQIPVLPGQTTITEALDHVA